MDRDRPCIFFDRDGVVNELSAAGYIARWEDFHLQPGFVAALRAVAAKGYPSVVITNQPGVAKGLFSEEELQAIHNQFLAMLHAHGLDVLDIYYCPHYAGNQCGCRKPKPGMLLQAAEEHHLDLEHSWMIGDKEEDVEAGKNAKCRTIRVCGTEEQTKAEIRVEHIDELAGILERELEPCA